MDGEPETNIEIMSIYILQFYQVNGLVKSHETQRTGNTREMQYTLHLYRCYQSICTFAY